MHQAYSNETLERNAFNHDENSTKTMQIIFFLSLMWNMTRPFFVRFLRKHGKLASGSRTNQYVLKKQWNVINLTKLWLLVQMMYVQLPLEHLMKTLWFMILSRERDGSSIGRPYAWRLFMLGSESQCCNEEVLFSLYTHTCGLGGTWRDGWIGTCSCGSVLDRFNDPLCTGVELQESFDVRLFIQTSLL